MILFPSNPLDGDLYVSGGRTFRYTDPPGVWETANTLSTGIEEAPEDGTPYSRQDAGWVPAAAGGGIELIDLSAANDPPSGAGSLSYDDTTGLFTFTPPDLSPYLTDAPSDGNEYVRLDGAWAIASSVASVPVPLVQDTIPFSSNQNNAYLVAATPNYTGASTDWGTYGFQHRFKTDGLGNPRITVDTPSGEVWSLDAFGNAGYEGDIVSQSTIQGFDLRTSRYVYSSTDTSTYLDFELDSDTGRMVLNGAEAFRWGDAGGGAVFIGTTGLLYGDTLNITNNSGIGTDTPSARLHIRRDGLDVNLQRWESDLGATGSRTMTLESPTIDSSNAPFRWTTNNAFAWEIDGTEAMQIAFDGTVYFGGGTKINGAGTTTLEGDLHVVRNNTSNGVVYLGDQSGGERYLFYNGSNYELPNAELGINGSTALHTGNIATVAVDLASAQSVTGRKRFTVGAGQQINAAGSLAALEVFQATGGADAFMAFHVGSDYAAYLGLDGGINDFVVGGWSMGNNVYRIYHEGNTDSQNIAMNRLEVVDRITVTGGSGLAIFNGGSQQLTLNSAGDFLVGKTTTDYAVAGVRFNPNGELVSTRSGNAALFCNRLGASTNDPIAVFSEDGNTVGFVRYDGGTSSSFIGSSDARLKTDVEPANDAGELIDAMQVRRFKWERTGKQQEYGFVAQELHEVMPSAVAIGGSDPVVAPWGVSPTDIVPVLVKEIQSLRNRVAVLEAA